MLGSVQPVYSSLYIFNSALSFDNSYCVLPVNSSAVLCHPQCCTPRPQDERLAVLRSAGTTTAWPGARAGGGPPENLGPLYSNLGPPPGYPPLRNPYMYRSGAWRTLWGLPLVTHIGIQYMGGGGDWDLLLVETCLG